MGHKVVDTNDCDKLDFFEGRGKLTCTGDDRWRCQTFSSMWTPEEEQPQPRYVPGFAALFLSGHREFKWEPHNTLVHWFDRPLLPSDESFNKSVDSMLDFNRQRVSILDFLKFFMKLTSPSFHPHHCIDLERVKSIEISAILSQGLPMTDLCWRWKHLQRL